MNNEKEQLEFAARAIKFEYLKYHNPGEFSTSRPGLLYGNPDNRIFVWNPYLDNDQAVLLSVLLKISIKYDSDSRSLWAYWCGSGEEKIEIEETFADEESALIAFRAAIVNVAAEIGRRW